MSRPDPRDPLVLDARPLAHRPGHMSTVERTVPAPEGLGIGVIAVPADSPVQLSLRLESVVEGILVSGSAQMCAEGECVRCLERVVLEIDVDLQELFAYPDSAAAQDPEDTDIRLLDEELIDIGPMLRDAAVLALPLQPLCSDDCPGLCPDCGTRMADEPGHAHEDVDPRWSALQGIKIGDGARATRAPEH